MKYWQLFAALSTFLYMSYTILNCCQVCSKSHSLLGYLKFNYTPTTSTVINKQFDRHLYVWPMDSKFDLHTPRMKITWVVKSDSHASVPGSIHGLIISRASRFRRRGVNFKLCMRVACCSGVGFDTVD
jgi:hypothetical protein